MTRRTVAAAAAVVVCGLLLGLGLAWVIGSLQDARDDVAALRGQLIDVGETPVVGPSGERGERGDPGAVGPRGEPGRDGRDGADGQTPPCFFEPGQCVGPSGPAGPAGVDGTDGVDGQDGADGTDGADGAPGEPGPQGPQGEPGPDACAEAGGTWTETDPPGPENRQLVCTLPDGEPVP